MKTGALSQQLTFDLQTRPLFGREDFFIASCNREAVKLAETFPYRFAGGLIYGEKGCGKTHLGHLFATTVLKQTGETTVFIDAADLSGQIIQDIAEKSRWIVLENVGKGIDEEAFFHLLNICKNTGGFLLITSLTPYRTWELKLPDLISRLSALPSVGVGFPDDEVLRFVLVKLFADRQVRVSAEVIEYLLKRLERSFHAAQKAVAEADALSLREKKEITVPLLGKLFR